MKQDVMIDAISAIDQKYIIEYVQYETKLSILKVRKKKKSRNLLICAACLALVVCMLAVSLPLSFIVLGSKPVQEWGSEVIENVLFPLDQEAETPDDPDKPTPPKQSLLQLNWIEWKLTENLFTALGAGTDDSVIDKLQAATGNGLVGESMQDLGDFLERLYEYYMKHKDEIDAIIGEIESESESGFESETVSEADTEMKAEPETEAKTEDFTKIVDNNLEYSLSETGDFYIVTGYIHQGETIVTIADYVHEMPVKEIAPGAFNNEDEIVQVIIPQTVGKIGEGAFEGCDELRFVGMPDTLAELGCDVFHDCYRLEEIIIPEGVEIIPDRAFENCSSLKSITIPESVWGIGWRAFTSCYSLQTIELPDSVRSITTEAFRGTLRDCDLVLPQGIQSIEGSAFYYSLLSSVYIPDGVTTIGSYGFGNCAYLSHVSLPNTLVNLEALSFYENTQLQSIEFRGTVEEWKSVSIGYAAIDQGTVIICTDGEIVIE